LAYRWENTGSLRLEWPRVPLTTDRETLLASAELGTQVAALLDTERSVPEVTSGRLRSEIRIIAVPSRAGGGVLNPDTGDLNVNATWGRSQNGAIMPGQGKAIPRDYTPQELAAIEEGARAMGLPRVQILARLGETTHDIYLNNIAYWKNVPSRVWTYTVGGYPVIKKWLSYRERSILGRSLTSEEVKEVKDIARRIAALLLLEEQLDNNYETVKQSSYTWPG
jgi:Type ISP C-terminal specificity domain